MRFDASLVVARYFQILEAILFAIFDIVSTFVLSRGVILLLQVATSPATLNSLVYPFTQLMSLT
jgi:hypothetical protein